MTGSLSRRLFAVVARNMAICGAVAGVAIVYGADATAPVPVSRSGPDASTPTTHEVPPLLSPVTRIEPVIGGAPLSLGWNGTRVRILQQRLGVGRTGTRQTFDAETRTAVIRFQRRNGLQADGVVGARTWELLAPEYPFDMDAWQAPIVVEPDATNAERIEAMVAFTERQLGSPYTWGGTGWEDASEAGFDCSGLVLQALYSAGLDPQPITVLKHAEPEYRTSAALYAHQVLASYPLAERTRCDLLFYSRTADGPVTHVALYLGQEQVIEAWSTDTHLTPYSPRMHDGYYYVKPVLKRPFA